MWYSHINNGDHNWAIIDYFVVNTIGQRGKIMEFAHNLGPVTTYTSCLTTILPPLGQPLSTFKSPKALGFFTTYPPLLTVSTL